MKSGWFFKVRLSGHSISAAIQYNYSPIMMFVMFSVFTSDGGIITPKGVFTILSLLSVLRVFSVHLFILGLLLVSEAVVGLKRIQVSAIFFLFSQILLLS